MSAISFTYTFAPSPALEALREGCCDPFDDYAVRRELLEVSLLADYDQLVCLDALTGVDKHWYQLETTRKVLRRLGGRALLADEVGLGKTIEAGLVACEYLARGMIESLLVLTPASLVSQWQAELSGKFGIETARLERVSSDPAAFWRSENRIVASLHTAKSAKHFAHVVARPWDLVIIDEAHHLKNRQTQSWKLVNELEMRFVLMLTATPVQNSLIELFNLLTLLKPGLLKTEALFRKEYVDPKNAKAPKNPEGLRLLMREVMVRNTRAVVDVVLPKRFASTIVVKPSPEEKRLYDALSAYVRENVASLSAFAQANLLARAGSSLPALRASIEALVERSESPRAQALLAALPPPSRDRSGKVAALLDLLKRSTSKTIVFTIHRATGAHLAEALTEEGIAFAEFRGDMSLEEKDAAIDAFRDRVPVLLASETAGEGRNIQFANTIVNYDLPWNPMQIEQRIGRVHRIGQTQDVFVFNFCLEGSIEEYVLRVLHDKINMFELVVGEVETILGDVDEEFNFGEAVLGLWLANQSHAELAGAFDDLADRLLESKDRYNQTRELDERIFGEDFEA